MADHAPDERAVSLSVAALPESLDLVHAAIDELWSADASVAAEDRIRFETAVVEIFANIVEHAFRNDVDVPGEDRRRLDVRLGTTTAQLSADFADNGLPAELDLSAVTMPADDATSGRGLALAIAAADDVRYERADGRNHWSITCRRGSGATPEPE